MKRDEPTLTCTFAKTGFNLNDQTFRPCGARYHPQCIKAGPPFTTRLRKNHGLTFPPVTHWGTFVCECCTVRAVLTRELHGRRDWLLMAFERMRIIDMAHVWARKTHAAYQGKLHYIREFERRFGFTCLTAPPLSCPPHSADIPLMWIQQSYSLRRGRSGQDPVVFGTLRSLRSAAGQFLAWETQLRHKGMSYIDNNRRVHAGTCRLTDNLAYTLMSQGQATRVGEHSAPSTALLHRHIAWLDRDLRRRWVTATTLRERWWLATAGLLNLFLWLGWLRSAEALSLRWGDVSLIPPHLSATADLPKGLGALTLKLDPATKTSRTLTVDVVIAYRCQSGLCVGWWYERLLTLQTTPNIATSQQLLFGLRDGRQWTSFSYRTQVLYPALLRQQLQGDGFLQPFTGTNSIPKKFWSLTSYRRGARTHSQRGGNFRRASDAQVYEHGRWRRNRSSQPIDVLYREWALCDRILITYYCF